MTGEDVGEGAEVCGLLTWAQIADSKRFGLSCFASFNCYIGHYTMGGIFGYWSWGRGVLASAGNAYCPQDTQNSVAADIKETFTTSSWDTCDQGVLCADRETEPRQATREYFVESMVVYC